MTKKDDVIYRKPDSERQVYQYRLSKHTMSKNPWIHIQKGPLSGLSFLYDNVKVEKKDGVDYPIIRFDYEIVDNPYDVILGEDEFIILGDILVEVLSLGKENKERKGFVDWAI